MNILKNGVTIEGLYYCKSSFQRDFSFHRNTHTKRRQAISNMLDNETCDKYTYVKFSSTYVLCLNIPISRRFRSFYRKTHTVLVLFLLHLHRVIIYYFYLTTAKTKRVMILICYVCMFICSQILFYILLIRTGQMRYH